MPKNGGFYGTHPRIGIIWEYPLLVPATAKKLFHEQSQHNVCDQGLELQCLLEFSVDLKLRTEIKFKN